MIMSLALGLGIVVLTLCVQSVPTAILIRIATSKHPRSLTRPSFWPNFVLFQMAAVFLALAHLGGRRAVGPSLLSLRGVRGI